MSRQQGMTLIEVLLAMALTRTLRLNGVLTALVGVLALIGALTAQIVPRQSILGIVPLGSLPGSRRPSARVAARLPSGAGPSRSA